MNEILSMPAGMQACMALILIGVIVCAVWDVRRK